MLLEMHSFDSKFVEVAPFIPLAFPVVLLVCVIACVYGAWLTKTVRTDVLLESKREPQEELVQLRNEVRSSQERMEEMEGRLKAAVDLLNDTKTVAWMEGRLKAAVDLINDMKTVEWMESARRSEKILEDAKLLDIDMSIC